METWKKNLIVCWVGVFATMIGTSQIAPVLPVYIEQLGVHSQAEIVRWAGIIFGSTFILMASVAPLWGKAADKYGSKLMLLRSSLGMAIILSAMAFAQNVYHLAGLRFLQGTISGFYSAAITLTASQTPPAKTGWALGILSTGAVTGSLLGPLIGGYLAEIMGIRSVFLAIGTSLLFAFLLSFFFVKEDRSTVTRKKTAAPSWRSLPNKNMIMAMFITCFVLQGALFSIQPVITVYVQKLAGNISHIVLISGMVFAAPGLAALFTAPAIGRLIDKKGPEKIIIISLIFSALSFIPQVTASTHWELMGYRFLMGLVSAGLLPATNTYLKLVVPGEVLGSIYGYSQSAQFIGAFFGTLIGGEAAARFGAEYAFIFAGVLLFLNATWVYFKVYNARENVGGKTYCKKFFPQTPFLKTLAVGASSGPNC
ncbi:MAG: MFS transporter [Sporomusaceae bacterium]|nr:MFS transporter [Sporomusaceae bacterium]